MNQAATLLVCAVLGSLTTCGAIIANNNYYDDRYLNWLDLVRPISEDRLNTLETLMKIQVAPGGSAQDFLRNLVDNSDRCVDSMCLMFEELTSLANPNDPCTPEVTMRALEISSILCDSSHRTLLADLANFLVYYGGAKFNSCKLASVNNLINPSRTNSRAHRALGRFFEEAGQLHMANDAQKLAFLRSLDFSEYQERFDIARGILYLLSKPDYEQMHHEEAFYSFFNRECERLVENRKHDLHIITLTDAFMYQPGDYPIEISKLKEYYRVCLSLKRPDMSVWTTGFLNLRIQHAFGEAGGSS